MERNTPSIWMPALAAGAVSGFLSGLPYIGCACCGFALGGGLLGAWWYSKNARKAGAAFGGGAGAMIGLVAGIVHGVVQWGFGSLIHNLTGGEEKIAEAIAEIENNPEIPADVADNIIRFIEFMAGAGAVAVFLAIGIVFAVIGGLIGGSVFKVEATSPSEPTA